MSAHRRVCLLVVLLLSATIVSAGERFRVVVNDLDANGVTAGVARVVSDHLRLRLIETRRFVIPERERMEQILEEQSVGFRLGECFSQECAVELGRIMQANKMIVGSVSLLNTTYSINIRFLDLESAAAEFSAEEKCQSEDDLFVATERLAARIAAFVPPRGRVTAIGDNGAIIDLGNSDGVTPGMAFRVLRRVERIAGYPEDETIGTARVVSVQSEWSRISMDVVQPDGRPMVPPPQPQVGDLVVGPQTVAVDEIPRYAYLMAFSAPVGAEVYIDDLFRGRTSKDGLEVRLDPGEHQVRISASAHEDDEQTVNLRPDQRLPVNATLEPRLPRRVFVMPITTFGYARTSPQNEHFSDQITDGVMQGMHVGIGRVYSFLLTEMGATWTFSNMAEDRGYGVNEVHRITAYGHAGLSVRFLGLVPYAAIGYDYGQLFFNEDNAADGSSFGAAGKIAQHGWYYQTGIFIRKWLHVSYRGTWAHDHSDMGTFSIGLNMSAF